MKRKKWIGAGLVVLTGALTVGVYNVAGAQEEDTELTEALDEILADPRLDGAQMSVVVRDAGGETLYDRNGDSRLIPASNTKLLTSTAAMDILGPDHRFATDVLSDGDRNGAVLDGDLYLRGSGDPTMLAEDYAELAAAIADAGITEINGDLVADDTAFDDVRLGAEWAWGDEAYSYAAQVSALTVAPDTDYDAGSIIVTAAPGAQSGDAPEVSLTPATDYVPIDNRATTGEPGSDNTLSIDRPHGSRAITVTGSIPAGADPSQAWRSVWEPTGYAADVFEAALADAGVKVLGDTRLGESTPEGATTLAGHESMTLTELLVPFLKLSNNGHAEVLAKAIGRETGGAGTWSAGTAGIAGYLADLGVDTDTLRQADGSGNSRWNLIPAAEFTELLAAVTSEPWYDDWYAALPLACDPDPLVGGTLASRMCDTPAEHNAVAKTGTMTSATALSGYVTGADGDQLIYSIVINDHLTAAPKDVEDAIVATLASHSDGSVDQVHRPLSGESQDPATGPDLECSWVKPVSC